MKRIVGGDGYLALSVLSLLLSRYFLWMETARLAHFEELMREVSAAQAAGGGARPPFDTLGFLRGTAVGPILSTASCAFKAPLAYPDVVTCGSSITALHADRFVMKYGVYSMARERIAAEGEATVVMYDYTVGKKTSIPIAVKDAITAVELRAPSRAAGAIAALELRQRDLAINSW